MSFTMDLWSIRFSPTPRATLATSSIPRCLAKSKQEGQEKSSCRWQLLFSCLTATSLAFDHFLPFRANLLLQFRSRLRHWREILHPFERTAGIDDSAGVEAFFAWLNSRIEGTAPTTTQNLDGLDWIRPAGQRPNDIERIRGIDIVVDNDDIAAEIGTRMNL